MIVADDICEPVVYIFQSWYFSSFGIRLSRPSIFLLTVSQNAKNVAGEIAPATAFMTGKVKISGDLTKALTLEKVMKAAREAEEKKQAKKSS